MLNNIRKHTIAMAVMGWILPGSAWAVSAGGAASTHINWWEWDAHAPPVGWFFVDFVLFIALLVFFVKKPLQELFSRRQQDIQRSMAEAARAKDVQQQRYADIERKLAGIEAELAQLRDRAEAEGKAAKQRLLDEAQTQCGRMQTDCAALLDEEARGAEGRLRAQVGDAAVQQARGLVQREMNAQDHVRLMEQAMAALETHLGVEPQPQPVRNIA